MKIKVHAYKLLKHVNKISDSHLKNIYNDTNFTHPCYSECWFLVAFLLPLLFHMKEQCFL